MSIRTEKVASTIRHKLGEILLTGSRDPSFAFCSVTSVSVSPDLHSAVVSISTLAKEPQQVLKDLQDAEGFFRHQLGRAMYLKFVPELRFVLDTSAELNQKISRIIKADHETSDR